MKKGFFFFNLWSSTGLKTLWPKVLERFLLIQKALVMSQFCKIPYRRPFPTFSYESIDTPSLDSTRCWLESCQPSGFNGVAPFRSHQKSHRVIEILSLVSLMLFCLSFDIFKVQNHIFVKWCYIYVWKSEHLHTFMVKHGYASSKCQN